MDPVNNVAAGNAQLGDRPAGALLLARDKGVPIHIIGATFEKSPYCVISLASKPIDSPKDMIGKTIATPTSGRALVVNLITTAGLDPASVNLVPASPDPAALAAGQIDGYVGYSTNQGVMLENRGVKLHYFNAQEHACRTRPACCMAGPTGSTPTGPWWSTSCAAPSRAGSGRWTIRSRPPT